MNRHRTQWWQEVLFNGARRALFAGLVVLLASGGLQARGAVGAPPPVGPTVTTEDVAPPQSNPDNTSSDPECSPCVAPRHGCSLGQCCACCAATSDAECTPRCGCFTPSTGGSGLLDAVVDLVGGLFHKKK